MYIVQHKLTLNLQSKIIKTLNKMRIAILGTGTMGAGLAEGILKAGHEVIAYNRTKSRAEQLVSLGAKVADTPSEAIALADASILVLADGKAVREILLDESTKKVLAGKKILNASTTTFSEIQEMSKEVAVYGGDLAEMSILVGAEQLREQQGVFLLGCTTENDVFWNDVLKSVGTSIYRIGEVGDASKAESPMLFGSIFMSVMVAHIGAVGIKLNLPENIIAQQLSMFAPGAEYLLPAIMSRNYSQVMASVDSFTTVADTAIKTADSLGIPTHILETLRDVYNVAAEKGFGEQDGTAIVEVLLDNK